MTNIRTKNQINEQNNEDKIYLSNKN